MHVRGNGGYLTTINEFDAPEVVASRAKRLRVDAGSHNLFGELVTHDQNVVASSVYRYGETYNPQLEEVYSYGSGSVTNTEGNRVSLNTSLLYDYVMLRNKFVVPHNHGVVNFARLHAVFDTSQNGTLQFIGLGNSQSDLYFCYTGTTFGVRRSTGARLQVIRLTITAAATGAESVTLTLNGVAFVVSLTNAGGNINFSAHEFEERTYSGWNVEHYGDEVYFTAASVGPRSGTYSFANAGSCAGTLETVTTGAALTTVFIPQSEWNGHLNFRLDPTQSNLYEIEYTWFGVPNILFKVYNPQTDEFVLAHKMQFANATTERSMSSNNLYLQRGVYNESEAHALSLITSGGVGGNYLGKPFPFFNVYPVTRSTSISAAVEKNLVTIKNSGVVNGYTNQLPIHFKSLSLAVDGNKAVTVRFIKNATLSPVATTADFSSYVVLDDSNPFAYDITSLTYSGGDLIFSFVMGKSDQVLLNSQDFDVSLQRTESLTITAYSANLSTVDVSVVFTN